MFLPWVYANEIPQHFIHKVQGGTYDVIDVYVFYRKLMTIDHKNGLKHAYYITNNLRDSFAKSIDQQLSFGTLEICLEIQRLLLDSFHLND